MNKPYPDERYYRRPQSGCNGKMFQWGTDTGQERVYECSECHHKAGEGSLEAAYRLLKMQD